MKKQSYEYQKLTPRSIKNGELKIGDKVTPIEEIHSPDGKYTLFPGDVYSIKGFLPNVSPYKGGFIIDYDGNSWGFWFDDKGSAQYMEKIIESKQDIVEDRFGDTLYKILKILEEYKLLSQDALVETVMNEEMAVPPDRKRKVQTEVIKAIYSLLSYGYIGTTKYNREEGQKSFMITEKGKQYLKAD